MSLAGMVTLNIPALQLASYPGTRSALFTGCQQGMFVNCEAAMFARYNVKSRRTSVALSAL